MKAIANFGPGQLELREVSLPVPGRGQVRIRVAAVGICATDLEMIAGWDRTGFPAIPGHEWSGVVDAAGPGADRGLIGRRCVAENVLADGGEVGFEHPGGYAEFLITEAANVHALPASIAFPAATLIEPLAVSVRGLRRLRLEDKRSALILGDGPIGLLMLTLLSRAGVGDIVVVGGRNGRLALARELGASSTINYHQHDADLVNAIRAAAANSPDAHGGRTPSAPTNGRGTRRVPELFPNVIEATGSAASAGAALELVAKQGKILIVGDYRAARADFPWLHLLHHEIELIGTNASAGAWAEAVQIAPELPLPRLVTRTFPAAEFAQAVDLVRGRAADVVKVILSWE